MANPFKPWQLQFEPKRDHKFTLSLNGIPAYFVQDVSIPQPQIASETKHTFLSHTFKFPGKLTWGDCVFTTVDPIDLNVASLFLKHIKSAGYVFPSNFNYTDITSENYYLRTIKKAGPEDSALNILQGLSIESLTSDGAIVERWYMKNSFIKTVEFGTYKYESEGLKTVKITLSLDWVDYESFLPEAFNTFTGA